MLLTFTFPSILISIISGTVGIAALLGFLLFLRLGEKRWGFLAVAILFITMNTFTFIKNYGTTTTISTTRTTLDSGARATGITIAISERH